MPEDIPVNGGVYAWRYGDAAEKHTILVQTSDNSWHFLGIRPNGMHRWSVGGNSLSYDEAKRVINDGTFKFICKLGDIFYGTRS